MYRKLDQENKTTFEKQVGQVNILLELLTVFSLAIVYPEEGSIAEPSVKILIITGQFYNF